MCATAQVQKYAESQYHTAFEALFFTNTFRIYIRTKSVSLKNTLKRKPVKGFKRFFNVRNCALFCTCTLDKKGKEVTLSPNFLLCI